MKVRYFWEPSDVEQGILVRMVYGPDETPVYYMIVRDRSANDNNYYLLDIREGTFASNSSDHKNTKESLAEWLTNCNCEPISELVIDATCGQGGEDED